MKSLQRFVVALVAVGPGAGVAVAKPSAGNVYFSDHALDPTSKTFEKEVSKSKVVFAKSGETWNLFFVAYLKKPAGATEVNLAFYETPPGGKRENVNAIPIEGIKENSRTVMSSVQLSPEQSFKAGHKYEVLVTRIINGKEEIYARSKIELK